MALRGIQEYIAQDANNIAWVEDISGNIFLYPPKKEPSNTIIIIFIGLCVSSYFSKAKRDRDWLPAAIFSVYKQRVWSAHMLRAIIVGQYSGHRISSRE